MAALRFVPYVLFAWLFAVKKTPNCQSSDGRIFLSEESVSDGQNAGRTCSPFANIAISDSADVLLLSLLLVLVFTVLGSNSAYHICGSLVA